MEIKILTNINLDIAENKCVIKDDQNNPSCILKIEEATRLGLISIKK